MALSCLWGKLPSLPCNKDLPKPFPVTQLPDSTTFHTPVHILGTSYVTPVFMLAILTHPILNSVKSQTSFKAPVKCHPTFQTELTSPTAFLYSSLFKTFQYSVFFICLQQTCLLHQSMNSSRAGALFYSSLNLQCLKPSCPKLLL